MNCWDSCKTKIIFLYSPVVKLLLLGGSCDYAVYAVTQKLYKFGSARRPPSRRIPPQLPLHLHSLNLHTYDSNAKPPKPKKSRYCKPTSLDERSNTKLCNHPVTLWRHLVLNSCHAKHVVSLSDRGIDVNFVEHKIELSTWEGKEVYYFWNFEHGRGKEFRSCIEEDVIVLGKSDIIWIQQSVLHYVQSGEPTNTSHVTFQGVSKMTFALATADNQKKTLVPITSGTSPYSLFPTTLRSI